MMSLEMTEEDQIKYVKEWSKDVSGVRLCLFIKRLMGKGFSYGRMVDVVNVLDGICPHCMDADAGCPCMRDE